MVRRLSRWYAKEHGVDIWGKPLGSKKPRKSKPSREPKIKTLPISKPRSKPIKNIPVIKRSIPRTEASYTTKIRTIPASNIKSSISLRKEYGKSTYTTSTTQFERRKKKIMA